MGFLDELQESISPNKEKSTWSGVSWSGDLARILAIPRRPAPEALLADAKAELEQSLKLRDVTCNCVKRFGFCIKSLNDTQAVALSEIKQNKGALILASVGVGKTGISLLSARVLPHVERVVLLIPPNLKDQLLMRDIPQWSVHFSLPQLSTCKIYNPKLPMLYIVTYSELSSQKNSNLLRNIAPDLIVADEAHCLKDKKSARTKRFLRLFKELDKKPHFVALSGTMTSKSIKDYAHLSQLALGNNTPLPVHYPTLDEWSAALDPLKYNIPAGQLKKLCLPSETVREGFRRRLKETLGVITTSESDVGSSLIISECLAEPLPFKVSKDLEHLRDTWQRPDGEELTDILEYQATSTQMSCGFYYRWVFKNGESPELIDRWLQARSEYNKEVREKLKRAGEFLDSPGLLYQAAERAQAGYEGPLPIWKSEFFAEWKEIEDKVSPETEPVWISKWLVENAYKWAMAHDKGIVWYMHRCFGAELEKMGLPRFGSGDAAAVALRCYADNMASGTVKKSIVASIRAHGKGKNLQHAFSENLITNAISDAATLEQLIGRTHRPGQPEDEVHVYVYRHTKELRESFATALARARYAHDTLGNKQKLCMASYTFGE